MLIWTRTRGLYLLLAAIVVLAVGLATGNLPALVVAVAAFAVVVFAWAYRHLVSGQVRSLRTMTKNIVPWGHALVESITIRNTSRWSVAGMRVVDASTLPQHPHGYVAKLPARRDITWDLAVPCQQRGRYSIGPLTVTTSDPLGLFPLRRQVEPESPVLVLPRWVELQRCAIPLHGMLPGTAYGRTYGEVPPAIAGIRAYQPGDALARIHWHASARTGDLLTKQFDPETQTTLWLALDLDSAATKRKPVKASTDDAHELLITVTASLAVYALSQVKLAVGLIVSGAYPVTLLPDRSTGQQQRLLAALAEVQDGNAAKLQDYALRLERHLAARQTLVLLTTQAAAAWSSWVERLAHRGLAVRVVTVAAGNVETTPTIDARGDGWATQLLTLPVELNNPLNAPALVNLLETGQQEHIDKHSLKLVKTETSQSW